MARCAAGAARSGCACSCGGGARGSRGPARCEQHGAKALNATAGGLQAARKGGNAPRGVAGTARRARRWVRRAKPEEGGAAVLGHAARLRCRYGACACRRAVPGARADATNDASKARRRRGLANNTRSAAVLATQAVRVRPPQLCRAWAQASGMARIRRRITAAAPRSQSGRPWARAARQRAKRDLSRP